MAIDYKDIFSFLEIILTQVVNEGTTGHIELQDEHVFGIWKMRFLCLHKSGGCMQLSPKKTF